MIRVMVDKNKSIMGIEMMKQLILPMHGRQLLGLIRKDE